MALSIPPVLARADGSQRLPRLGGMARPDGVVIVSERFWAFATVDGVVHEGEMPKPRSTLARVPLVRGLVRLGLSLSPLFRGRGVAGRRERAFLAAALILPVPFVFLPESFTTPAGLVLSGALLAWLLRGRVLRLHGAEHRAISAAEQRRLEATWDGAVRPTRFAARCGTNFAALVVPVALLAQWLWPLPTAAFTPLVVVLLSLAVTMELWLLVQASGSRAARAFLLPGLALQRLTTREPSLAETQVALLAAASVLRRELESP